MKRLQMDQIPKERILDEAEALFAEKGFNAVTVREITHAAHCNLASVNYHFGGKERLYLEVFRTRWIPRSRLILRGFNNAILSQDGKTLAGIIHALAEAFLKGPLTDEERLRHAQLMIREMARPTAALDMLVEQVIEPFFKELATVLAPFMADGIDEERLLLNIISVFSMVIYFNFARIPVRRVTGQEYDERFKDRLVDHIVQFSLAGLGRNRKDGI